MSIEEQVVSQAGLLKAYSQTKLIDRANRTVTVVASTLTVDRDREIVLPTAFANLDAFLASNAPLLAAHTHRASEGAPTQVGWVQDMRVEKTRVVATIRFAETDLGEQWWLLASDPAGRGIAVSIGFYVRRMVRGSSRDLAEAYPELRRPLREAQLPDDASLVVITELELIELSVVPVPANREALQQLAAKMAAEAAEAGGDAETQVRALVAEISGMVAEKAAEAVAKAAADMLDSGRRQIEELMLDAVERIAAMSPDTLNEPLAERDAAAAGGGGPTEAEATARAAANEKLQAAAGRLRGAAGA